MPVSHRIQNEVVGVLLMCDLDNFKRIDDSLGHRSACFQRVAEISYYYTKGAAAKVDQNLSEQQLRFYK